MLSMLNRLFEASKLLKERYTLARPLNMTDEDYGQHLLVHVENFLKNGRHDIAFNIINNDEYFKWIGFHRGKILDLNIFYKNAHNDYSEKNFKRTIELKIGEVLLTLPEKVELNVELREAYTLALIRWFDVCFRCSENLRIILQARQYDGAVNPQDYNPRDGIVASMEEYVEKIMNRNKRASIYTTKYITTIIKLDENLNVCKKFDEFLKNNKRHEYVTELFSAAKKLLGQESIVPEITEPKRMSLTQ